MVQAKSAHVSAAQGHKVREQAQAQEDLMKIVDQVKQDLNSGKSHERLFRPQRFH